jgi:hypothetical protein
MMNPVCSETCWSNFNVRFILEFYIEQILISTTSRFECISRLITMKYLHNTGDVLSATCILIVFLGGGAMQCAG